MAILSKYRKNKKEGRNSILPKNSGEIGGSPTSPENGSSHEANRQVSNSSSTVSGGYESMAPERPSFNQYRNPSNGSSGNKGGGGNNIHPTMSPQFSYRSTSGGSQQQQQQPGYGGSGQGQPPQPPPHNHAAPPNHFPGGPQAVKSPPSQQQQQQQQQHYNKNLHSQFPWSQVAISNASPFPRYGHAANPVAARDGEVFVMGGLKGSNVFGDLWVIDSGKFL